MKHKKSAKKGKRATSTTSVPGISRIDKHGDVTEYQMVANKLTILYAHVKNSPTVTTTIVYRVGSQHERTGETGLAHMLEHMLFKPTSGKGVKWKDLENKGAHLNATTWLDRTLYYFTLPKQYLGDMFAVEADRMRNTIFTDAEFLPERANVQSEYHMNNNRPEAALDWQLVATAFQYHGYHHDTIGFKHDIDSYTTEKLKSFYDRHYWPENATLIVSGDINEHELLSEVKKHFGHLKVGAWKEEEVRVEEEQEGTRRVALVRETPVRMFMGAFKAPSFSSPDWLPLFAGLHYLTSGETSPLYKALVDTGLSTQVEGHLYPTHDPFLAFISAYATETSSYDKIESVLRKVIAEVIEKKISEKDLALIKENLLAEELFSRDGSCSVALSLAEYVAASNWKDYAGALDAIVKISCEDILTCLKKYLVFKRATIGTIEKP